MEMSDDLKAAIEAALALLPNPLNLELDLFDAFGLPEGLLPETYAQFIWVWAHLHHAREAHPDTYTDEVWDEIAGRMAEEAEIAAAFPKDNTLAKAFVGHSPLDWASRIARLAKGSHL